MTDPKDVVDLAAVRQQESVNDLKIIDAGTLDGLIDDLADALSEITRLKGAEDNWAAPQREPCPSCERGDTPIMLDEHGTRSEVSGEPGRPGHAIDDYWWYCDQYEPKAPQRDREAMEKLREILKRWKVDCDKPVLPKIMQMWLRVACRDLDAILAGEKDDG